MLDFWNSLLKGDNRDYLDEILHQEPFQLYLTALGAFNELHSFAELAADGCLKKGGELEFSNDIGIPVCAIVAYCDTHTSIDTQCVVELLHAIQAELKKTQAFGGGPATFPHGPKRSAEDLEYLNRQLWIVQHRLGNHLYSKMNDQEREEAQKAIENSDVVELWAPAMTRDHLCRILIQEGAPISKKTLSRMIKDGTITTLGKTKGAQRLVVKISDLDRLSPNWREIE